MDCETVRQSMDEGQWNASMAAHLEACATCREEAEFARRVAAAVASMPPVPAPQGLLRSVMAELRPSARVHRPTPPRPSLVLRPWEMSWLGIACLLFVALVPAAFGGRIGAGVALVSPWLSGWAASLGSAVGALTAFRAWRVNLSTSLETAGNLAAPGEWMAWISGAAAFALAFFVLLSWYGSAARRDDWEDGHA